MIKTLKGIIIGALALAGVMTVTAEADAMPVQPLAPVAAASQDIQPVYFYRYGYRRPFVRPFYAFRRPFYGYRRFGPYGYGFRRPFYAYRRPYYGYGYGYRRF